MPDSSQNKPKRGPIVPRMVKPPSMEKVREILARTAPPPVVLEIGQYYEGQGVYVGQWTLTVPAWKKVLRVFKEKGLTRTFNVFAAPEDLPGGTRTYLETLEKIAGLKNWCGHDGTNYANHKEIHAALKDGSYNGGWIIPPAEVLRDLLYPQRETVTLAGTFRTVKIDFDCADRYWSSTDGNDPKHYARTIHFSDGREGSDWKDGGLLLSCRPVRLVPV